MRKWTKQAENAQSKKNVPGKILARKLLPVSVTCFEVSPYDFIKTIALIKLS